MSTIDHVTIHHANIDQRAHALRRQEISHLFDAGFAAVSDLLRRHHEQRLRRRSGRSGLAAVNGTPA